MKNLGRYNFFISLLPLIILLHYSNFSTAQGNYIQEYHILFERAQHYYDEGDYVNAFASINKSIEKYAAYPEAYLLRGRIYETQHKFNKALFDYSLYLEWQPDDREVVFLKAVLLFKLRRFEDAIIDFKHFLQLASGETNVILFRQTKYEAGIDRIMSTQGRKEDYIYNYIALCYLELKKYVSAIAYLDTAISINALDEDYYYHRGIAHEQQFNHQLAESDYLKCLNINPEHAAALNQLNQLELKSGNKSTYIERLNRNIAEHPSYPFPYQQRANYYLENKEYKAALADLNALINITAENSDDFMNRALVKEKLGDSNGAEEDYIKSIELNATNEKAYLNLGNFYVRQKKYEASLAYYNLALYYDVNYALALYNRAIAHYYLKDNSKACADMLKAKQLGYEPAEKEFKRMCN